MDRRGWVPATSGNLSARLTDDRMAITRSGVHKGFLATRDIIVVDFDGVSLTSGMKPSAETLLHCQLYRLWPDVGAVLHGHSVAATALTLALPEAEAIDFEGYEIVKAWSAFTTHEVRATLPVIDNDQDMHRLAGRIRRSWRRRRPDRLCAAGPRRLCLGHGCGRRAAPIGGAGVPAGDRHRTEEARMAA